MSISPTCQAVFTWLHGVQSEKLYGFAIPGCPPMGHRSHFPNISWTQHCPSVIWTDIIIVGSFFFFSSFFGVNGGEGAQHGMFLFNVMLRSSFRILRPWNNIVMLAFIVVFSDSWELVLGLNYTFISLYSWEKHIGIGAWERQVKEGLFNSLRNFFEVQLMRRRLLFVNGTRQFSSSLTHFHSETLPAGQIFQSAA